ncbi:hypothetical protein BUALT_BualtUnG0021600 [Buddleja alternifolia]|uniref:Transmembrane protein n=1 Tax=Buddleja alternifolia TaxID=168488 RepID=A0AAV6W3Q6_9LAMI|nr:hypothetical protein BUALT_BualtUnG0021600 [Buddleja alternifolia]
MSAVSLSVSVEFHRRREFGPLGRLTTKEEGFLLAIIPGLLRGRNQLESKVVKLKKDNRKVKMLIVITWILWTYFSLGWIVAGKWKKSGGEDDKNKMLV